VPTRVLSDNLLTSRKVNLLKAAEFESYVRILLCVDDYGFFSADPVEIARTAYPRREDITSKQIQPIIDRLREVGLIVTYSVSDEPFLMVTNFMNSPRAKSARYPAPDGHLVSKSEWEDDLCTAYAQRLQADAQQLQADACNLQASAPLTVTVTGTVTGGKNRSVNAQHLQADARTHGSANNVRLTDDELNRLKAEYPELVDDAIEFLSLWLVDKGDKSKAATHNATIRRWVLDAVREKRAKGATGARKPGNVGNFTQREYSAADVESLYMDVTKIDPTKEE
jgi:hypothetical protein